VDKAEKQMLNQSCKIRNWGEEGPRKETGGMSILTGEEKGGEKSKEFLSISPESRGEGEKGRTKKGSLWKKISFEMREKKEGGNSKNFVKGGGREGEREESRFSLSCR